MSEDGERYLREVQYRNPGRLQARALLHTRYGRGDWFDWLVDAIPLPAGGMVADVGCGAGGFWTNAPSRVPDDLRLRLFDLAPGMVDAAASALRDVRRWSDVEVRIADATALPLPDGGVDTALAIHMLYHLDDPAAGLAELRRVVGGDGVAAVVLNAPGNMGELSALVDAALDRRGQARGEPLTSDQAIPLLRERFRSVDRLRFDDNLLVKDAHDLLAYLLSLPIAEAEGVSRRLAHAVAEQFSGEPSQFRIRKATDLLSCRG